VAKGYWVAFADVNDPEGYKAGRSCTQRRHRPARTSVPSTGSYRKAILVRFSLRRMNDTGNEDSLG
jgi:hypothetical protein